MGFSIDSFATDLWEVGKRQGRLFSGL